MNCCNDILSPSDLKLPNPIDRCCQENGTLSVYNARLRHLGATSIFGEFLNCSLRDHFVFGIRNPATPKKLLSVDRTFQEALQVAIADEMAGKETLEV